jgi:hypothetical protein
MQALQMRLHWLVKDTFNKGHFSYLIDNKGRRKIVSGSRLVFFGKSHTLVGLTLVNNDHVDYIYDNGQLVFDKHWTI